MSYQLRPYQQQAVNSAIDYFKRECRPAVIVLPTGAGKSLVIAELARRAKGRVLILAHVKELVAQNHEKFQTMGMQADIFSAGLARKQTQKKVVFGSVQSVARNLAKFTDPFSLLIIDECHRIADDRDSQYQHIIKHLGAINPQLKLLGLTATPFRLGSGWIYQYHYHGMVRGTAQSPFYQCIFELPLRFMIKEGYLTPPRLIDMPVVHYNFANLSANKQGLFTESEVDRSLQQQRRITPRIISQIIELSQHRRGVMVFAATVRHAEEILDLLPANSALIAGKTPSAERDRILQAFKQQKLKFLVNVAVLTTGFDAPHVDVIAILRPTESVSLYQQIAGRGLRLFPDKKECLILDYAGNHYDLFRPEPGSPRPATGLIPVQVHCPLCQFANIFWGKTSTDGQVIEHYGRRCQGLIPDRAEPEQCQFRFRFKICEHCGAENDIAGRICLQCQHQLVDPDDMLKAALQLRHAKVLRCAGMTLLAGYDQHGQWLKVTYHDEDGAEISEKYRLATAKQRQLFTYQFLRQHQAAPGVPLTWQQAEDLTRCTNLLRYPDFIVARKQQRFWKISHKIFDYHGRYRKANQHLSFSQ